MALFGLRPLWEALTLAKYDRGPKPDNCCSSSWAPAGRLNAMHVYTTSSPDPPFYLDASSLESPNTGIYDSKSSPPSSRPTNAPSRSSSALARWLNPMHIYSISSLYCPFYIGASSLEAANHCIYDSKSPPASNRPTPRGRKRLYLRVQINTGKQSSN